MMLNESGLLVIPHFGKKVKSGGLLFSVMVLLPTYVDILESKH